MKTNKTLSESASAVGCSIDKEAGIIRNVKILGCESKNGRYYLPECLKRAVSMYEGAKVNVDHALRSPSDPRSYRDRIGVLRSVRFEKDSLYGDLHYNTKHALAEQLAWDAEHSPTSLGLSHNVEGKTSVKNGRLIVEEIVRVQSVDLVADPATTSSLYESNMDDMNIAPVETSPADAVSAGFRSAIMAVLDDASADVATKVAKIKDLLKAHEAAMSKVDPKVEDKPTEDKPAEDAAVEEHVKQIAQLNDKVKSLTEELDGFKVKEQIAAKREAVNKAIAGAKLPAEVVSDVFVEQCMGADSDRLKKLIEDRASLSKGFSSKPKSVDGSRAASASDAKSFLEAITSF